MHIPNSRSGMSLMNVKLVGALDMQGTMCLIDPQSHRQLPTALYMNVFINDSYSSQRKQSIIGTRGKRPSSLFLTSTRKPVKPTGSAIC